MGDFEATHYHLCIYHIVKNDTNKSTGFVGQPIFSQLFSLINKPIIRGTITGKKLIAFGKSTFCGIYLQVCYTGVYKL